MCVRCSYVSYMFSVHNGMQLQNSHLLFHIWAGNSADGVGPQQMNMGQSIMVQKQELQLFVQ